MKTIKSFLMSHVFRDQARGRLGRNSRLRDRNFDLVKGIQEEVGVPKKKIFFFFFFFF